MTKINHFELWSALNIRDIPEAYRLLTKSKFLYTDFRSFETDIPICCYLQTGRTPASAPMHSDFKKIINYLLENGEDINRATPTKNETPLHWAAFTNDFELVKFLLEKGANPYLPNKDGYMAGMEKSSDGRGLHTNPEIQKYLELAREKCSETSMRPPAFAPPELNGGRRPS